MGFAEIRNDESSAPGIKWAWINPSRRSALDSIKFVLFLQTLFLKQNGLTNSYVFKIKISRTTPLSDCECETDAIITWYIYGLEISYSKHFEEEIWGVDYINECWIGNIYEEYCISNIKKTWAHLPKVMTRMKIIKRGWVGGQDRGRYFGQV